jgi:hypothetical protein
MKTIAVLLLICSIGLLASCSEDMPGAVDGNGCVTFVIADTSGIFPLSTVNTPFAMDSTEVRLKSRSHEFSAVGVTDAAGRVTFENLVSGWYDVFARREVLIENNRKVFTGGFDFFLAGDETLADSVFVNLIAASDLMINEVFYCGSDYSTFYFYDQYVELYNAAADTMYLDGIILTRQAQTYYPDQEVVDYVRAIYAYQFPGMPVTGRQYPIAPGQFVVIAADAIDHTVWNSKSIDLSVADWECFNPFGSDYDAPGVPNIERLEDSRGPDYMINLSHNGVVIATGEEWWSGEEPNPYDGNMSSYIYVPIHTVIDGIEYASRSTVTKELTRRVDAGFAGLGCTKYSGQSTERRELGLDTNDSSFDFDLIARPTVGFSHVRP